MQITKYYCDKCCREIKDEDKNAVFMGDIYCNDSLDGGHKSCAHVTRLFCIDCAFQLFAFAFNDNDADDMADHWLSKGD